MGPPDLPDAAAEVAKSVVEPAPPAETIDPSPPAEADPPEPAPSEPAPSEPAPSEPAAAEPEAPSEHAANPASGGTAPPANGGSPDGATGGGGGDDATGGAPAGGGRPDPEPVIVPADGPERTPAQFVVDDVADQPDSDSGGNLSTRIGDLVAALPFGVLVGLVGLGVVALLMTGRSAWFARVSRRLNLQRQSLQADVGALQAALVPDLPPAVGGVGVLVAYRPAAGPAAGGDFHDVFELDDGGIGIVLGDVSGHGREALPRTGVLRYTIRAYLEAGLEPRIALRLADRALGASFDGDFASAVAATYEPSARRLVYSCAGHPQPVIVGGDGSRQVEILGSPPIGIGHPSGTRQTTLTIPDGAELWFFTGGLAEARSEGAKLGRDGLCDLLDESPEPGALLDDLQHGDGESDDLTVCRLRPPDTGEELQPFSVEALLVDPGDADAEIAAFAEACGLEEEDLEALTEQVGAARRYEGQVLVRISRLENVLHWRVERVEEQLGRTVPPVEVARAPI